MCFLSGTQPRHTSDLNMCMLMQLTSKKSNGVLKATDFGLSRFFKEGQVLNDIVGSPFYVGKSCYQPPAVFFLSVKGCR